MRGVPGTPIARLLTAALLTAGLAAAVPGPAGAAVAGGAVAGGTVAGGTVAGGTVAGGTVAGGTPLRARVTGAPIRGTSTSLAAGRAPAVTGLPAKKNQVKVLTAVLDKMRQHYAQYRYYTPGPEDVFDYGVGSLWRRGIDGAGTTVAVIEGWDYPGITAQVDAFDKIFGLPNPQITTIYPAGRLPAKCPPGMVRLGSYGSCSAWAGELTLDVLSAHLMAPYAKIVISATPADTQETDDAASQVAPPEMMEALEYIARHHAANVISISDGTGESSYSRGQAEILAQSPGELAAAAAGIPVLVATGDCGVLQNLPAASSQCENTSGEPDTAAWDDSPWVTAVGGSLPNLSSKGDRAGSDPLWSGSGAGYSSVFARPSYQDGVARITGSAMRSVPDITLDSSDGTSEAAPMLNGILALATQVNHGNVGPINPALYQVLGPAGLRDGIADVIHGSDPGFGTGGQTIAGFTAAKGFDVASGWGTIRAAAFVPTLAAATRAAHQDAAVRRQARAGLTAAEHGLRLSAASIARGGRSYLLASGFLPGHPVGLSIDGHAIARLTAGHLGTVTYMIDPGQLKLPAGRHVARLSSMLVTMTRSFSSH